MKLKTVPGIWVILLLATVVRFYNLAGQSLWSDEGNSVALARQSFADIAQRTAFDIHPPFYYWLLKIWTTLFGNSEVALRSLSALLGVGVVYLVWLLGRHLFNRSVGWVAAFIAAVNPLLVYYSQEARMYMLLAFLCCLTLLLALRLLNHKTDRGKRHWFFAVAYIFTVTAGLYTHYAYALILVVVNLAVFAALFQREGRESTLYPVRFALLWGWLALQLIPLLLYLPWLPTAWRQLTTWPSEPTTASLSESLQTISNTLLFGLSWPFASGWSSTVSLVAVFVLAVTLAARVSRHWWANQNTNFPRTFSLMLLYFWFLFPVLLTIVIFSPAFLKFLVVAAPSLALLLALVVIQLARLIRQRWSGIVMGGVVLFAVVGTSALSLYHYYTNPVFARDNYRGIVRFIWAVSNAGDAVILNAEGQQDVFNYYYRPEETTSVPVYPLPRHRPLSETETVADLQDIALGAEKVYAVYWASQQADPAGVIENWLNTNLYKATDQWYGNVRLVSYASPQNSETLAVQPLDYLLGQNIWLMGYGVASPKVMPGDILQVGLQWLSPDPPPQDYTVFLQLLDAANHLVGQRDAAPLVSVSNWPAGELVLDAHGIFVEPGTLPGRYRLVGGLYNSQTGQRLPVVKGDARQPVDFIELDEIEVVRSALPLPPEAFNIQIPVQATMGNVTLLGYDMYKPGHRSSPHTMLSPGDPVHLVTYWQLQSSAPIGDGQFQVEVVTLRGESTPVSTAGQLGFGRVQDNPHPGEIIRVQNDFFLNGLTPGAYRLKFVVNDGLGQRAGVNGETFLVR